MKKRVAIVMMLCITHFLFTQEQKIWPIVKTPMTLHQAYVLIREFICLPLTVLWVDEEKYRQARVYCNVCNYCMDSGASYGYMVAMGANKEIARLKRLWQKYSVKQIERFMCRVQNDMQFSCVRCMAYHGWHIQESSEPLT